MGFFAPQRPVRGSLAENLGRFSSMSVRNKLLVTIIPLISLVLLATGYATRLTAVRYLNLALERTTKVLTMGQANALAEYFENAREDLLLLSHGEIDEEPVRAMLTIQAHVRPGNYREVAYIPANGDAPLMLVDTGQEVVRLTKEQCERVFNSPLMAPSRLQSPKTGSVTLVGLSESIYPPGLVPSLSSGLTFTVFRMVTPVTDKSGKVLGFWVLSLDGRAARDILSLHNSPKSPLAAFARTAVRRYSFFFDSNGWILFQSGSPEDKESTLATDVARSGLSGDHGMPGLHSAFRPAASNETYWRMVVDVQNGQTGIESVGSELDPTVTSHDSYALGYSPVFFLSSPEKGPEIVGGVAFMDRSKLVLAAEYRIFDVLLLIFVAALLVSAGVLVLVGRYITRPVLDLARAVRSMPRTGEMTLLELPVRDKETTELKDAINTLVVSLIGQKDELKIKDASLKDYLNRQPLDLDKKISAARDDEPMEGIIGAGQGMRQFKQLVRKAASVDADVLIVGETGTGKEVTAQAIHRMSRRAAGPYITMNCGALDENLLMDALFGHVKGAFSEAKTDRKGAFLAANGGSILLDEIGNASPKVQQALLRALAERTIIPLGSDQEVAFDARVIAATNENLMECVAEGLFREDLYYRLKVLTLQTLPLRERKEDIPLLVDAFIRESAQVMRKGEVTLSQGAWERIAAHDWPGNVRELKHCLMRAVAMADSNVILMEDLRFEGQAEEQKARAATPIEGPAPARADSAREDAAQAAPAAAPVPEQPSPGDDALNPRQRLGLAYISENGSMSRAQYQSIVGQNVPPRTAQYDLRDLVERGLLVVKGRGPATRYHPPTDGRSG
ncbi:sigma 54-interacting transcriptional regulator [Fundidesulfovibrio agrisoli]|uniref:sigma 54-interacting transcriptional regulator n=1 Tax=Fundidesulfovibrio agrisoli TaxID=2922717 RepID=UPI001FAC4D5B|nr:sigma-54 dependent transcriptional regulator [Fundidesulfovibrio agrisoli]